MDKTRLHCPTLIGPIDRLWLALLAEAKAAGADIAAGEAAFMLTHEQDEPATLNLEGGDK